MSDCPAVLQTEPLQPVPSLPEEYCTTGGLGNGALFGWEEEILRLQARTLCRSASLRA